MVAPSENHIRRFISEQRGSPFSYPEVGASAGRVPPGYNTDCNRIQLGMGEGAWNRAVEAIRGWQMLNIPWVHLYWPNAPIQVGTVVALLVRVGACSLNACRIVYVVDEDGPIKRFGFAYGTLTEHAVSGEERFTVEWNRSADEVWFEMFAFSRPRGMLVKLGYPLSRLLQRKIVDASKAAMLRAVNA